LLKSDSEDSEEEEEEEEEEGGNVRSEEGAEAGLDRGYATRTQTGNIRVYAHTSIRHSDRGRAA
jgi:hypothetical protein